MVKGVCKRLEFNYKLLTSSDTLAKKKCNGIYIYISNGCYNYFHKNMVGVKNLVL